MLLIYPPIARPCEPPAGIAKLSGVLREHGIKCTTLDANLEGILYLLQCPQTPSDKWTRRAFGNLSKNLSDLRKQRIYHNIDQYKRSVMDINRVLEMSSIKSGSILGLTNYRHQRLSPLSSIDLIYAAENPELNPFYPYFKKRLAELLERDQPSTVGFSLNYLSQALCTFAMIGFLRKNYPGLTLVIGGGLVTSWMRNSAWQNPFRGLADYLIPGPGERRLLSIMGIDELKKHCPPDYDSLSKNDYLAPGLIFPYSSSSGCHWNKCSFCPEKVEGNPYVPIPVDHVITDLNALTTKLKPVLIHLLDNAISTSLLKKLAGRPLGAPWYGFTRINRYLTDTDFCRSLKDSGCVMLKLGLESGNQGVLDQMKKGLDIKMASLALKTLKKAGIATYIYLLFGTPWETLKEARATLEFTVKHSNEISFLNLSLFNMPLDASEADKFETTGFYKGDLSLYTGFSHPKGWNRKLVRQFLENEFKKHGAVSSILKKNPPLFTSSHAPFFMLDN